MKKRNNQKKIIKKRNNQKILISIIISNLSMIKRNEIISMA